MSTFSTAVTGVDDFLDFCALTTPVFKREVAKMVPKRIIRMC